MKLELKGNSSSDVLNFEFQNLFTPESWLLKKEKMKILPTLVAQLLAQNDGTNQGIFEINLWTQSVQSVHSLLKSLLFFSERPTGWEYVDSVIGALLLFPKLRNSSPPCMSVCSARRSSYLSPRSHGVDMSCNCCWWRSGTSWTERN